MRALRLIALLGLLAGTARAASLDPWASLTELRDALTSGAPVAAPFSQTYIPVGFSSGDTEHGVLVLGLPDCARWDYDEPFSKSFLLCGDVAWVWNPGETSGRRYQINPDEEQGLELLRLELDDLRKRFEATISNPQGVLEIRLDPIDQTGLIGEATLTVAAEGDRLESVAYLDREGNRTLFELGPLEAAPAGESFDPPPIQWLEN